jgi:hypothetical protein
MVTVGYEVLTAVAVRCLIFWFVMPRSLESQTFRRNLSLLYLELKFKPSKKSVKAGGNFIGSENGGYILLRNIRLSPNYTALQRRKLESSM